MRFAVAAAPLPGRQLTEPESLRLLAGYGVRTVPTVECDSVDAAVAAAERLGYPVVLKGVADGLAHKSDLGLVHVGLRDADSVVRAYAAVGCPSGCPASHDRRRLGGDRRGHAGGRRRAGDDRRAGRSFSPRRCTTSSPSRCRLAGGSSRRGWRRAAWGGCWPALGGSIRGRVRLSSICYGAAGCGAVFG